MKSSLARHPLVQHGGLIFLGQILLVLLVPLVDRGEVHTPVEMFAGAIAVSAVTVLLLGHRGPAVGLAAVCGLAIVGLLVRGEMLEIRLPGTILLVVAYVWASSLCVRHADRPDRVAASHASGKLRLIRPPEPFAATAPRPSGRPRSRSRSPMAPAPR